MTAQQPLSPLEIADALEQAMQSALAEEYGLFNLRVAIQGLFRGTAVNPVEIADHLLPRPPGKLNQETVTQIRNVIGMLRVANSAGSDCTALSSWIAIEESNRPAQRAISRRTIS